MRRRLLTFLLAVALVLCAAAAEGRSPLHPDRWSSWLLLLAVLYWMLPPVLGFPGAIRDGYREATREDRQRNGLCPVCGYDLRASPDRCPECGAVPGRTARDQG